MKPIGAIHNRSQRDRTRRDGRTESRFDPPQPEDCHFADGERRQLAKATKKFLELLQAEAEQA